MTIENTKTMSSTLLIWVCVIFIASPATADITIGDEIVYFFGAGPGENLSVANDKDVIVAIPLELKDKSIQSVITTVTHEAPDEMPFTDTLSVLLNGGEVTDVAPFVPQAGDSRTPFTVVNVRDDKRFKENALYVIQGSKVTQTIFLPDSADGIGLTPNGNLLVVAVEKEEEIHVYDSNVRTGQFSLAAVISKAALRSFFSANSLQADDPEPESVAIAGDGSFALVSIQEASAIAAIDLKVVAASIGSSQDPHDVGEAALATVVKLPFGFNGSGFKGSGGKDEDPFGLSPDGVCISPDQSFAIAMGESDSDTRHLQSISVLDLRRGLSASKAKSYCIFDIDPTLLGNTGLDKCPQWTQAYPDDADRLPELGPASCKIVERGGITLGALIIERYKPSSEQKDNSRENENKGSLLLLNLDDVLNGNMQVIDRVAIGPVKKTRLEAIDTSEGGRWMFISISNGGGKEGTFARVEIIEE